MNARCPLLFALTLCACATAPVEPSLMSDAELCYSSAYARGAESRALYRSEIERRAAACTPALAQAERQRRIDRANEQPPPYYYGGP